MLTLEKSTKQRKIHMEGLVDRSVSGGGNGGSHN